MVRDPAQDLALLRRFEPVIRYVHGELFLPMSVADYVADSRLVARDGQQVRVLAERGSLTLDGLAELGLSEADHNLSLEHVEAALNRREYRAWRRRPEREKFRASSRFAAVSLPSRLIDVGLRLTLLLRGRVPGGFAAAAHEAYVRSEHYQQPHYYAHVTCDGGYTILQYWYFYAMNDWRSTFGGVNDHESDWEQVTIYLVPEEVVATETAALRPAWVAYSSHDEVGADLRRRWDDPDLSRVGEHPVVFAGAGSHSGSYLQGEYLITSELPLPAWLSRVSAIFKGDGAGLLRIPYIDYKRGDGATVGEGGDLAWTPVLVEDTTPWVRNYSGLWGLDTEDPFGGERAPAGLRYNRNGTLRASWERPVAWAALDMLAPTAAEAHDEIVSIRDRLVTRLAESEQRLSERRDVLRGAHAAEMALGIPSNHPGRQVVELDHEVAETRRQVAELTSLLEGAERSLERPAPVQSPHAHLRHRALPLGQDQLVQGRALRVWTALSASLGLLILGILMLVGLASTQAILWLGGAMIVIEALLRRRLVPLLLGAGVVVVAAFGIWAIVSIVLGHLGQGVGVLLIIGALYMGLSTLREATR
ncbi:MAG: hypothetical protein L0H79_02220 [Intrasporangium sp.]|uniref:hypothetical protein n=1 Tax=Intrasporangium sp. TaxID=1925024 RepID=UPI0026480999|nr:hypothetical protein [Intrasporangium sp.]MDN5794550.1 hypothetical protein [Intrasporangium sp.]